MVPTYNEKENIGLMLKALEKVSGKLKNYHTTVLVVDDSSPDGTGEVVRKFHSKAMKTKLAVGQKVGLGRALIRGYQFAVEKLKADLVASIDADFLFDPNDLPKLIAQIDSGADVAIGSRHHEGGFRVANWPRGRYITHWVANNFFASWVAGNSEVHDHNGNFRVIKSDVLKKIEWDNLPSRGYGFLNYMIYELGKSGAKFAEVPIKLTWRTRGESKVSFNPKYFKSFLRDTVEYIYLCLKIRILKTRDYLRQLPLYL